MKERYSLAELAIELKLVAWREAVGVEALEVLAAQSPDQRVFAAALREARLSAALVGEAYGLLRALIPHEPAVRALLDEPDEAAA